MANKLSEGAAEFLAQDMHAAERELQGLDAQIGMLQAKREGLTRKIELLRCELENVVELPAGELRLNGGQRGEESREPGQSSTGMTFRDFLRKVLQESSRGMKPKEVQIAVRKLGYSYEGVKDPSVRTSSELWRMAKAGAITKRGPLYFARPVEGH